MNYAETVEYLFTRLPMFSRIGAAAYRADLQNTLRLCGFLGNPERKFKSIHVAGTNGKGSVSHMLASVLHAAGYKTGLYTSPHLRDFRERIKLSAGASLAEIDEQFVIRFTEKINSLIAEIDPSFFEITVAMAFEYFAEKKVDIAIIETGLGGRLDSTNVIVPELAVITNIGMDHQQILGDTLAKIAAEKAGIIKESVPVVIGEILPETEPVFVKVAKEMNAPLFHAAAERQVMNWSWDRHELVVEVAEPHRTDHQKYKLDLAGIYQLKNLLTVLETCSQLKKQGWAIDEDLMKRALQQSKKISGLHGRWEIIHEHPLIVLDVAHNVEGIRQLVEQIEVTDHRQLHLVIGFVKDKDVEEILGLLPKTAEYYFTRAHIPRALDEHSLTARGSTHGLKGIPYADVHGALEAAKNKAAPGDLIIVCGSVFLVGECY